MNYCVATHHGITYQEEVASLCHVAVYFIDAWDGTVQNTNIGLSFISLTNTAMFLLLLFKKGMTATQHRADYVSKCMLLHSCFLNYLTESNFHFTLRMEAPFR